MEARRLLRALGDREALTLTRDEVLALVALLAVSVRFRRGRRPSPRADERDHAIAQATGESASQLAERFHVDESTVYRARRKTRPAGNK